MDYSSQLVAGPSARGLPTWPSNGSQSGKRALTSDGEGGPDESEEDDGGGKGSEAPKKRRRRQALSCTECKRRKIKCDRQHPCGPCVRRTEADKCHWNVVEPADKYVLRTEWDTFQHRFEALERGMAELRSQREAPAPKADPSETRDISRGARAASRTFSPDRGQAPLVSSDAVGSRLARLESFLTTFAPEAWARFQAEEESVDPRDRRESRGSMATGGRLSRSEGNRSVASTGSRSLLGVPASCSESSISLPTSRRQDDNTLPRFQPFVANHAPSHGHSQPAQRSPRSPHPLPQPSHQEHYARPILPRGTSDQFPLTPIPSTSHISSRLHQLDGPLPGPRSLPGFGGPKSEASGSSRPSDLWDAHVSSRVLPPPLPSPRSRTSGGTSISSTVFSEGRRTSDPNPIERYDGPARKQGQASSRHDELNTKHDELSPKLPGSGGKHSDGPAPPQVFLSFAGSGESEERAHLLSSVLDKSEAARERGSLPDRTTCDLIVDYYFKRVAWNHNLLYPASFYESYRAFFDTPPEKQRAPFVALLLVVLCVGLGNMSPARAIREGICKDTSHWKRQCAAFWSGSQKALGASDVVRTKELEVVQTLVMMMYCNESLDDNGWQYCTPFLGFAVRIAHSIGLSRLGSEVPGEIPPPGLRERELKRRVWWNLVFFDWYLSPVVRHTYLIHPAQCTTALPANADWEDMRDGERFEPKDRREYTGAAFLITKLEVATSVRELSDHINAGQPLTYEFLTAYQRRCDERVALGPSALTRRDHILEQNDRVAWERIMLTFGLNHRGIRLHRRFMLRGYAQLEFRGSTEACIAAAKNVLHIVQEGQAIDFPGASWWVVCMVSFAAAVVLLMDQFYAHTADGGELATPAEMELRRHHIHQAIELLNAISETLELARRAAHVLRALLEEVGRQRRSATPLDIHPSPYTSIPPSRMGRLLSLAPPNMTDAYINNWVSEGLAHDSVPVPDGEFQSAPLGARGFSEVTEAFWAKVFELDFPVAPSSQRPN